jgi:hypothetical protein
MDPKPRPNHRRYLEALHRMGPQKRLQKAFELSEMSRRWFVAGLRKRFPDLPEPEFRRVMIQQLNRCRNRSY